MSQSGLSTEPLKNTFCALHSPDRPTLQRREKQGGESVARSKKDREKDFKKKLNNPEKNLHNYMELFLCRISRLAKDNTKGRVIIFAHYLEKIQMKAVLSQGDDHIVLIPAVKQ